MNKKSIVNILKCPLSGVLISCWGYVVFVIELYVTFPMIVQFALPIPSAFIVYYALKNKRRKWIIGNVLLVILGYFLAEVLLYNLHVTDYFYYKLYPDATEYSMGEGILLAAIWLSNLIGSITGIIAGFVSAKK